MTLGMVYNKMSENTIRDLFRSLEQTLHERLRVIEDVMLMGSGPTAGPDVVKMLEEQSALIKANQVKIDALQKEVEELKKERYSGGVDAGLIARSPLSGIEIVPKREAAIPIAEAAAPFSYEDRLLLNKKARKALEAKEMGVAPLEDVPDMVSQDNAEEATETQAEEEEAAEEEGEEVEEEEAVAEVVPEAKKEEAEEEAEPEEEAEEAEEEAEAEEETEEVSLEEFEYKGSTYYKDEENNVYMLDEDGELTEPIGVWSEVKKRIIVKKPTVE